MSLRPYIIATCLLLASSGLFASADEFTEGRTAYDQGDYAQAAKHYQSMLDQGIQNVELRYNLANALFRSGDLPQAVVSYREAWYQAPRDPDINANLRFALSAADAIEPASSRIERFLTSLSSAEWVWVAIGGYLTLTAILIIAMLTRKGRPVMLKLSLIPVVLLLLAAGGWWQWRQFRIYPEAVLARPGATARFAPLDNSMAHFKLPAAALVRMKNRDSKGWAEIEYDGKTGWVKRDQLLSVYP